METLSLRGCSCEVQVLGIGHLAAAVRVELARRGLRGEGAAPIVVACSDFENPPSFKEAHSRALGEGSRIVFACLEATAQHPRLVAARRAALVVDRIAGFLT